MPYGVDNALVKPAHGVRRVADSHPPAKIVEEWRTWLGHQNLGQDLAQLLTNPDRLDAALSCLVPVRGACWPRWQRP
jgi:hypothetical protein